MADTTNKVLERPATGTANWDTPLNANFGILDAALGNSNTMAVNTVTGATPQPIALTETQYQGMALLFSGLQSVNIEYQVPSGIAGQWVMRNNATGAFTITISSGAGGPKTVIPQGEVRSVYTDGTVLGMVFADTSLSITSTDGQVLYNDGGAIIGDAALLFNGVKLTVSPETAATNAATQVLRLSAQSSGTPAAGVGPSIEMAAETAPAVTKVGGMIQVVASDVTPASEDFRFILSLMAAGTIGDVAIIASTGEMTLAGNAVITAGQTVAQSLGTAGITATADNDGTKTTGTYTPTPVGGNFKRIVNGGAFTLAAPTATGDYTLNIQITNNASAGAITMTGFNKVNGGFTTTNGDDFFLNITKNNGFLLASIQALQ